MTKRSTLEAIAGGLRVHPTELTGQPWTPQDPVGAEAQTGLTAIETALERYQLGADPEITVRDWPQIAEDLQRLDTMREFGQVLEAARTAHPELLPSTSHQAGFWADVGRALVTEKKTRDKAVRVLVHAEQLAPAADTP